MLLSASLLVAGLHVRPPLLRATTARRHGAALGIAPASEQTSGAEEELGVELGGAVLNEVAAVTVSYSSGPRGRTRRVRRTTRPPIEELWETSLAEVEDAFVQGYRRMSTFCKFAAINLEAAVSTMESDERFRVFGERISIVSYADVVHVRFTSLDPRDNKIGDAFLFPYGPVLLWGFTSEQEARCLDLLAPCAELIQQSGTASAEDLSDVEFMLFRNASYADEGGDADSGGGGSVDATSAAADEDVDGADDISCGISPSPPPFARIANNVIQLQTDDVEERLAISFAFAQSAKLSVLEAALEATTEEIKEIPEQLARTGRSSFSAKKIGTLTGRVFLQRNEANLYANILDSPTFFWEAEAFEPLYRRVNTYLDVEDRVGILNNKLDIVNDLLEGLSNQLEIRNSHRLEWIIIVLIMIEIGLDLLKEIEMGPVGLVTGLLRRVVSRFWVS